MATSEYNGKRERELRDVDQAKSRNEVKQIQRPHWASDWVMAVIEAI